MTLCATTGLPLGPVPCIVCLAETIAHPVTGEAMLVDCPLRIHQHGPAISFTGRAVNGGPVGFCADGQMSRETARMVLFFMAGERWQPERRGRS